MSKFTETHTRHQKSAREHFRKARTFTSRQVAKNSSPMSLPTSFNNAKVM
jgi:hypothetical protein